MDTSPVLVVAEGLKKYFSSQQSGGSKGTVKAVDGITLTINRGETLGLVGESGCGKSTLGRLLLRLIEPSAGSIRLEGEDITHLGRHQLRPFRQRMQIVFQDPFSSLNPRHKVADILAAPLIIHGLSRRQDRRTRVAELLERVGLRPNEMDKYPHQFSGGQRQRIGIARALALNPSLIVCDEAVSALDVSIQAQIINLLRRLQDQFGMAYLFIAHDLAVVEHISHRVAVMYLGQIVELAQRDILFSNPRHPYTEALMAAAPIPDPARTRRHKKLIVGEVPSPLDPPSGCRFHTRCPIADRQCRQRIPELTTREEGRLLACHKR